RAFLASAGPGGDGVAQPQEVWRRPAERVLEQLGPTEVAVDGVVGGGAHATVEVLARVGDALATVGDPELGDGELVVRVAPRRQPPDGRPRRDADRLGVDVRVGRTQRGALEGGDRAAELLALTEVARRDPQGPIEH